MLGAVQVLGHDLRGAHLLALAAASSLRCWALEEARISGRVGDGGDQVGHRALCLRHRPYQARRPGGLSQADVQADVGLPVGREVLDRVLERRADFVEGEQRRLAGALGGQHRRHAELHRQALVADVAPFGEHPLRGGVGGRLWVREKRAPPRPRVAKT